MALNVGLRWSEVSEEIRKAFCGYQVEKQPVEIPAGFMLCKFTEYELVNSTSGVITPWWSPAFEYQNDPGLQARIDLAEHLRTPVSELARVVAAVTNEWNAMTHLLKAQLTLPVWGFWGQCSSQHRHATPAPGQPVHNLPGYAWQFYIPNLSVAHIMSVSFTKL